MFDIDYFLYGVFVAGLVAVYGIWSFNQREITIRRLEEDRKDARQDIAKEQMKQMKQMQYQHELDLQKLELQIQNGQDGMAELVKSVLPLVLNKRNAVSENVSEVEELTAGSKPVPSLSSEAVSSTKEDEEQKELREYVEDAEPVTDFRRFVDSEAGDAFFHRYQKLLNK